MPAAAYACRDGPRTPGAWPSTCWAPSSSSLASAPGSAAITPGKFIISASPSTRRRRISPSRSPSASGRRGDSNADAGTHDGAMKNTSSWRSAEASWSQWTPSEPRTFAISCGSATTAVVPSGSTRRANSSTSSFTDSRCMCASMKPGTTKRPAASIVSEPSYDPTPAILPSTIATSASSHSRVNTERTRPPPTTTSAGSSPRATARRRCRDSIAGTITRDPRRAAGRGLAIGGSVETPHMRLWLETDRPRRRGGPARIGLALVAGGAAGATALYFVDPVSGRRRRKVAHDRVAATARHGWRRVQRTAHHVQAAAVGRTRRLAHLREEQKQFDDVTLARKVETMLFRDPRVPKGEIDVNVQRGVVQLRGVVPTSGMLDDLAEQTRAVEGVLAVESPLDLRPQPAPMHQSPGSAALDVPSQQLRVLDGEALPVVVEVRVDVAVPAPTPRRPRSQGGAAVRPVARPAAMEPEVRPAGRVDPRRRVA